MIANRLTRFAVMLMALLGTIVPLQAAQRDVTFTGEVTYRERIAMPPNAELRITLMSLGNGGPHAVAGATEILLPPGQVPLQFRLNVRSNVLNATTSYGLRAEILSAGTVIFRNATPVPVDPAAPAPVMILVNSAPRVSAPPTPSTERDITSGLFDIVWQVRDIGGAAIIAATDPSLSIAQDRRVGGNGGCNNYFTEADFGGPALSFGPVAGTRMACAADVMAQEAAFFAALDKTASYQISGSTLQLLDAGGNRLVALVRGQ